MDKEQEIVIESGTVTNPVFDETEFFHKEIEPRLMEVLKLCQKRSIPFFCTTEFSGDKRGKQAVMTGNYPGARCSGRLMLIKLLAEDVEVMEKCAALVMFDRMMKTEDGGKEK